MLLQEHTPTLIYLGPCPICAQVSAQSFGLEVWEVRLRVATAHSHRAQTLPPLQEPLLEQEAGAARCQEVVR